MGQIQTFDELIGLLIRRRWLVALVIVLGTALSLYLGASRAKTYEATAVIQVELPVVADARATTSGSAGLLQAVEQRLFTRENLVSVIERHALFADAPGLAIDQKVGLLRGAVRLQSVASVAGGGSGPASVSAILITARLGDPEQAARLANDFAQSILDLSSAGQSVRTSETLAFYREEAMRVGQSIVGLENEIADYKNAHGGSLPALRDAQRDELLNLDSSLRALAQTLVALTGERASYERKDVLRATDRNSMESLSTQIEVAEAQRAALLARRTTLEQAIATIPEVERELSGYDRRLQQLQDQYDLVNTRLAEAETAQRLAERQQAERFSMLERAITPLYASGSGGKKLAAMGAVASVGLAVALAFVLDLLNPVVRTRVQMERQLDLRPVVAIPELRKPRRKPARQAAPMAIADLRRPVLALPRLALILAGAVLVLFMAAAAIA